jgi:hypothetical protein
VLWRRGHDVLFAMVSGNNPAKRKELTERAFQPLLNRSFERSIEVGHRRGEVIPMRCTTKADSVKEER